MSTIVMWQPAMTNGSQPPLKLDDELEAGLVPAGPWEIIGCGIENGRQNGGIEDMETVFCWRRPITKEGIAGLASVDPVAAEVASRSSWLREASTVDVHPSMIGRYDLHFARLQNENYAAAWFLKRSSGEWVEVDPGAYETEVRAVAIRATLKLEAKPEAKPVDVIAKSVEALLDAHFVPVVPTSTAVLPNGMGHRDGRYWVADFAANVVVEVEKADFMLHLKAIVLRRLGGGR